ncbi:MAG: class I fructose-bisphosphate aldolase [Dongiaceae bacterium]
MMLSAKVKKIIDNYESDNKRVKANLAKLFMTGRLGGTGQLIILPVDQGFEHGPARSFAKNPLAYDPHYFYQLGIDAGLSAYAAPLGALEAGACTFKGRIPLILKINSNNSLQRKIGDAGYDQAVTASVKDAVRLGCSAIGFTLYQGSDSFNAQLEELRDLRREAAEEGLATIVWCYARGNMSKEGELGIDTITYGAHMACLAGAHIIKVKLPSAHVEKEEAKKVYTEQKIPLGTLAERVRHVVQCCFNGRRPVVFSGGETKTLEDVYTEARAIRDGGGNGSIIGRNSFQRPRDEALKMFDTMVDIFKDKQ